MPMQFGNGSANKNRNRAGCATLKSQPRRLRYFRGIFSGGIEFSNYSVIFYKGFVEHIKFCFQLFIGFLFSVKGFLHP